MLQLDVLRELKVVTSREEGGCIHLYSVNELACLKSRVPSCGGYCKAVVFTKDQTNPLVQISLMCPSFPKVIIETFLKDLFALMPW